jgi:hypothetical protein
MDSYAFYKCVNLIFRCQFIILFFFLYGPPQTASEEGLGRWSWSPRHRSRVEKRVFNYISYTYISIISIISWSWCGVFTQWRILWLAQRSRKGFTLRHKGSQSLWGERKKTYHCVITSVKRKQCFWTEVIGRIALIRRIKGNDYLLSQFQITRL